MKWPSMSLYFAVSQQGHMAKPLPHSALPTLWLMMPVLSDAQKRWREAGRSAGDYSLKYYLIDPCKGAKERMASKKVIVYLMWILEIVVYLMWTLEMIVSLAVPNFCTLQHLKSMLHFHMWILFFSGITSALWKV